MRQAVARDGNVWEWRVVGPSEWLDWSTGNGTLDNVPPGSVEAIYASYVLQVPPRCLPGPENLITPANAQKISISLAFFFIIPEETWQCQVCA